MAARPVLVVLVIGDAALRSVTARRLAMHGVELLSMGAWREALMAGPTIRRQSMLVADGVADGHFAEIERQRREGQWRRVVMLTPGTCAANDAGGLASADRCAPAELLSVLFADETQDAAA